MHKIKKRSPLSVVHITKAMITHGDHSKNLINHIFDSYGRSKRKRLIPHSSTFAHKLAFLYYKQDMPE